MGRGGVKASERQSVEGEGLKVSSFGTMRVAPEHGGWFFDQNAIRTLQQMEHLRAVNGDSLGGINLIFELMREVEDLQERVRFLRL